MRETTTVAVTLRLDPLLPTCSWETACSILRRVCRVQEQDDWVGLRHCCSQGISSHRYDT